MSDFVKATFSAWLSTDPKLDRITNTVYFRGSGVPDVGDPNWQNLATDILGAFNASGVLYTKGCDRQMVRVYDMEDLLPRSPKAEALSQLNTGVAGAREVACCLSFRGAQNVPRQRGRIFMGPFAAADLHARPQAALITAVLGLADRLAGIGGQDIDWCVFSQTTVDGGGSLNDAFKPVQMAWVDDAWDTQRSRGLPPTTRSIDAQGE